MNEPTEKTVLCLGPDEKERDRLTEIISANQFSVVPASSLGEALEWMSIQSAEIVLMEIPQSQDLTSTIRSIRKVNPGGVILLMNEGRDFGDQIDRCIGQIFEVVEKPIIPETLVGHLNRAFSFFKEKDATFFFSAENEERMKFQLEWLLWKQKTRIQEKMDFTRLIVDSIRHSISQGLGIGSVVTLGELMEMDRKKVGDRYSISASITDSLIASSKMLDSWLRSLERLHQDFLQKYDTETLDPKTFSGIVTEAVARLEGMKSIKGQVIHIGEMNIGSPVQCNREVLDISLRELIVNALKYSPEKSNVDILLYKSGESYTLAVVNDILLMGGGVTGIPPELENQVFEPFFRLNNMFDERYQTGRAGMGLGLTMVQNLLNQVGGRLFIHEARDYLRGSGGKRVIAEVILPVEAQSRQSA